MSRRHATNETIQRGVDSGLNMIKFKVLQTSNLFIDKEEGCDVRR